jgi:hypothetical protein
MQSGYCSGYPRTSLSPHIAGIARLTRPCRMTALESRRSIAGKWKRQTSTGARHARCFGGILLLSPQWIDASVRNPDNACAFRLHN